MKLTITLSDEELFLITMLIGRYRETFHRDNINPTWVIRHALANLGQLQGIPTQTIEARLVREASLNGMLEPKRQAATPL